LLVGLHMYNLTHAHTDHSGFDSTIASVAYPSRFSSLSNSYVITPTVSVDQTGFFHYPNYTQGALDTFTTTKGEYSLGQQSMSSRFYAGPVL
jgi:hypothetical protein